MDVWPRDVGAKNVWPRQRVGMIGLGKMGLPSARNLAERGFEVIGYPRGHHTLANLVIDSSRRTS